MMRSRRNRVIEFFPLVMLICVSAILAHAPLRSTADDKKTPAAEAPKNTDPKNGEPSNSALPADEKPAADKPADEKSADERAPTNPADPTSPLKRLMPEYDVWIDPKNKHVVIEGEVCLTRGLLEMFACLKGTKEHESVVSANTKAYVVHAALLALGAKSGSPAKWEPKYTPATGTQIDIMVYWTDAKGEPKSAKAQEWVRDLKTKKPLEFPWVFAGSAFHRDERTGMDYYLSDASGDFICVSNFPSAMLDLPVESSQANAELAFEAFTDNIPPRGTKVKLVLMPKLEKKEATDLNRRDAETQRTENPKHEYRNSKQIQNTK